VIAAYVAFLSSLIASVYYVRYRCGLNLTLSSMGLLAIIAFHGPAYLYYLWIVAPDSELHELIMFGQDSDLILTRLTMSIAWTLIGMMIGYEIARSFSWKAANVM
jgi:hypothetical protein